MFYIWTVYRLPGVFDPSSACLWQSGGCLFGHGPFAIAGNSLLIGYSRILNSTSFSVTEQNGFTDGMAIANQNLALMKGFVAFDRMT